MLLAEYLSDLVRLIEKYSAANLITSSELNTDFRTEKIGIIKGAVTFLNDSRLLFTEYLDLRNKVERITYSYHYQKKDETLIFRYDNAAHKPQLTFDEHKHLPSGETVQSDPPDIKAVFEEIMKYIL